MYKHSVDLFACSNGSGSDEIFLNALINPSGFLVNSTADESAKYSLFLESASCKSVANIGESIRNIIPIKANIALPELLSLFQEVLSCNNFSKIY